MHNHFLTYENESFFDELVMPDGTARLGNEFIYHHVNKLSPEQLVLKKKTAEASMINMGITFQVYSEEGGTERIIPMDIVPRVIPSNEWNLLEKGLKQRIYALNQFLLDIYGPQRILKDKVIPSEVIFSSKGYLKNCAGIRPPKDIYIHITGTDLIRDHQGNYLVLEDNLRCPSGVSYMLANRDISKNLFGSVLNTQGIRPIGEYPAKLFEVLRYISGKHEPTIAVLTPGIYNSAYYEHSFLSQQMGIELVDYRDLVVHDGYVKMRTTKGFKVVDVLYRRLDDVFLDPLAFNPDSLIGIPGIFDVYKNNRIGLANALGTGVADDKVVYAYVPEIIRYYLGEEAILSNVETFLCENPVHLQHVLQNIGDLVVKEANEAGGYGMLIGPKSTLAQQEDFKEKIKSNPRNFIAQPTISLSTSPCVIEDSLEPRHVDLRPYILYGEEIYVAPGGLTRVALKKGSLVVNSSQGGGSKDTWVLND
ncbi:MAG: circularly permuted type 2 ATP-grasp protein [Spirosomataceae bacterium]